MLVELEYHVTDLLPAYVLDALTDDELAQVVEHLAICRTCHLEYESLQAVADDLPLAVAQTNPPARAKTSLMHAIHTAQAINKPVLQPAPGKRLSDLFRTRLPALGLLLIVLLAVGNLLLWRRLALVNQQASTPMRVVNIAGTQNSLGAAGTLIMDPHGNYGTLVVDNLAALDASHQYQVWLVRDGQRVSGGVFSVNPEGYASLEILAPMPLIQYDSIGVTIEPYGGSPGPTGAKVLGSSLPH